MRGGDPYNGEYSNQNADGQIILFHGCSPSLGIQE